MFRRYPTLFLLPALLTAWLAGAAPVAHADEAADAPPVQSSAEELTARLDSLQDQTREHIKEKNESALEQDTVALLTFHQQAKGHERLQRRAIDLMGDVLRAAKGDALNVAVITALGDTLDLDAARLIKPYLSQRDDEVASPVLLAAVRAVRKVPDSSVISSLMKVFEKSKHNGAAREAMESLGYFHHVKGQRTKILETIIDSVRRCKPGSKGNQKGMVEGESASSSGDRARNRWDALKQAMPPALSRLTGRDLYGVTADEWFSLVDEYKGRASELFLDRD